MINVDRTAVAAPTISNKHRTLEILTALGTIGHNKCYLCEKKFLNPQDMEVEHLRGRGENLTYNWNNLLLACSNCNGMKPKIIPPTGYLDPCNPADDVETLIHYLLEEYGNDNPLFLEPKNAVQKTKNTVKLLKKLHHGHDNNSRLKTASLREVIRQHASNLITHIVKHKHAINGGDHETEQISTLKIEQALSRTAPFTMLLRSIGNRYGYSHLFD